MKKLIFLLLFAPLNMWGQKSNLFKDKTPPRFAYVLGKDTVWNLGTVLVDLNAFDTLSCIIFKKNDLVSSLQPAKIVLKVKKNLSYKKVKYLDLNNVPLSRKFRNYEYKSENVLLIELIQLQDKMLENQADIIKNQKEMIEILKKKQ